jgi:hypothetical protein
MLAFASAMADEYDIMLVVPPPFSEQYALCRGFFLDAILEWIVQIKCC